MSKVASLEKSESFESTSRSISPLPLDTEMTEEEAKIPVDYKMGAQANFMGLFAGGARGHRGFDSPGGKTEMKAHP
ncbi:hypothetical protein TNIN_291351 [Trichonephila inaurata madagascariensis]|uniref:Uncharacterized protein n=1 Tax=Trichonephila inaurata madagascariensis TaxID=2747483 RepID=A0A8X6JT64_9ARAC|nr:hypothetical protein TNIN_291351 [Trichonephila inaurata madagascariensis]